MTWHPRQRHGTLHDDAEFLVKFTGKRRQWRFAGFEFPAGKFPHAGQMLAGRSLRQQNPPLAILQDAGHHMHDDPRWGRLSHQLLRRYSTMSKS